MPEASDSAEAGGLGAAWKRLDATLTDALRRDPSRWHPAVTIRPDDTVRRLAHDAADRVARAPCGFDWTSPLAALLTEEVGGFLRRLFAAPPDAAVAYSGSGTESIFLAVRAARDWARHSRRRPGRPEILLPSSAHPAFDKAADCLGLAVRRCPLDRDYRADVQAMAAAVTDNTVLLAGSLPSDCHGRCDPIPALAALARRHGLWCHVDACLGGFLVPFLKAQGAKLPDFDFRVAGVRSISADMHKYGYAPIGSSALVLRDATDRELLRFSYEGWDGARLESERLSGTASLGPLAGAWTALSLLGEAGLAERANRIADNAASLEAAISALEGIVTLGPPEVGLLHYAARGASASAFARHLKRQGWRGNLTTVPPGLVVCVGAAAGPPDIADYAAALAEARERFQRDAEG